MRKTTRALCAMVFVAVVAPAHADEFVYLAQQPGTCVLNGSNTYSVYVYSGDYTDVTGMSFRLDCDLFQQQDITSLTLSPGVTIVSGSLFNGIVLAFSARALNHDPVLTVQASNQQVYGNAWMRDVWLVRGAAVVPLADFESVGDPIDCFGDFPIWYPPDTVQVAVDHADEFSFKAILTTGNYPPAASVTIDDPAGWVVSPFYAEVNGGCGWCPWNVTTVTVPTYVPSGVTQGTIHEVTAVFRTYGTPREQRTVVLRAVGPLAVERRTWGSVKALYR